jgi:hypothetical protein
MSTGTYTYNVTVTNTNPGVNGTTTASATSNTATVTADANTNAEVPVISTQSPDISVNAVATVNLTVSASVTDGGALSYQWYGNTANSNTGGTIISGATGSSYTPPTTSAGTVYYYAEVTNTIPVGDVLTATLAGAPIAVTVNAPVNAAPPTVSGHPQGASYTVGQAATALSVGWHKSYYIDKKSSPHS